MDLYCRNRACEYYSRPIELKENLLKCPKCGTALLGGLASLGASNDLSDGPPPLPSEPPQRPAAPPEPAKTPAQRPKRKTARPAAQSSHPAKLAPSRGRDDPNMTRPLDGFKPGMERKPRFVLELIEHGRAYPVKFIDEARATPIYGKSDGDPRRHLADLRSTPEGIELAPVDPSSGFFVQIHAPVRLANGSRFRIGNYVVEARVMPAEPHHPSSQSGEADAAFSKDLVAKGELVFLRPDGSAGVRFPVLQKIVIGRGGPSDSRVDIPLLDANVSRKHAAVAPGTHGLKLKNLSQTDGTFIEVKSPTVLVEGDRFRLGERLLQLVRYPHKA
jgi:hypothetical protein